MDNQAQDGAQAPADDNALFTEIASLPAGDQPAGDGASQEQPGQQPAGQQQQPQTPAQQQQPEANVPSSRLREEAEARRTAERERDELRGQVAALSRPQQPATPQQPQQAPDFWENPAEATRHLVAPQFDSFQQTLLSIAKDSAIGRFTEEKVDAAEKAFITAMNSRTLDPADYQRVVSSPNRYSAAVQWHQRQLVQQEVGTDPTAYKNRVLEEALKDPAFLQRATEAAKGAAQQSGNNVVRAATPANPAPASIPSITRVGAAALPEGQEEVSDSELFNSTTRRKRSASG